MSVLAVQAYIIITSYTADYTNEDIHKRIVLHSISRSMQMTVYKTFFFLYISRGWGNHGEYYA